MLKPEYLLRISEGAEQIAEELHSDIINRIIKRIMERIGRGADYILTPLDKWQLEVLRDAGFLLEDIQKEIARRTKLQEREVAEAMQDVGIQSLAYDDKIYLAAGLSPSPALQAPYFTRLIQRGYEATMGEWYNFTRTTANAAQRLFISSCDKAYHLTMSGAVGYTQAVKEAVNDIASGGVYVNYTDENGMIYHRDTIETATLRAVRTGAGQTSAEISEARMEEMDWDIVLVSSHLGARPGDGGENPGNHFWWQGKFYSRNGKDKRFPPLSVTGYGTGEGLCGWNCRHSFGPGDGVNNPFRDFDSEENQKEYELQQRQRALERRIRNTKRDVMGRKTALDSEGDSVVKSELEKEYQRKAALLQKQNKEYNDFCEENNLKKLQDRLQVAKWDRQQAAAASGAARKYNSGKTKSGVKTLLKQDDRPSAIPESVRGNFDDFEELSLSKAERDAVTKIHELSEKSGHEYGVFIKDGKAGDPFTSGLADKVAFDTSKITPGTAIFHSHTNETPLSTKDFSLLLNENVERIGNITRNNDVFVARVGYGWRPSKEEFDNITALIEREILKDMQADPNFALWTEEQRNYMVIREKAYRIARAFEWKLEGGNLDV